jgi:hypothetical protein
MIKDWLNKERVNRVEKGTSQDMCPTNGDALFMAVWFSIPWTLLFVALIFGKA